MSRAISDLIGFSLMFSIIILGVALVSTAGFAQLSEISQQERISTGERGMEAFAADMDDITREGDLARSIQLSPSGGLIWLNDSHIEVTVDGPPHKYSVNSLEHRFSTDQGFVSVNYESGAVTRSDGGLAVVNPRMRCDESRSIAMVTLVSLVPDADLEIGSAFGSGTSVPRPPSMDEAPSDGAVPSTERGVFFDMSHVETNVTHQQVGGTSRDIQVDVSGAANAQQWNYSLERMPGWQESGHHVYECVDAETIVVREVVVELSAST